jgi:drug/metabolite transporter (DMT)-like permease
VSSGTVIGADRLRRREEARPTMHSVMWFGATGLLNGGAVLSMYAALSIAPVSLVAPIVAAYPVITALVSAAILRDEALSGRVLAGGALTVSAIIYLVMSTGGR